MNGMNASEEEGAAARAAAAQVEAAEAVAAAKAKAAKDAERAERKAAAVGEGANAAKVAKPIGETSMEEDELRAKLRPLFERFDADGSGAVSCAELGAIVSHLGLAVGFLAAGHVDGEGGSDASGDIDTGSLSCG